MILRHPSRRPSARAVKAACAAVCLSALIACPAGAGVEVRFAPDDIPAPWHRGEALVIPAVNPLELDPAHAQGPPAALTLSRFLLHAEAGPFADYLFPAPGGAARPAQYGGRVQLAHDGTHLHLWARMDIPPGKQVTGEGLAYGVWPGRDDEGGFDNTEFLMLAVDDGTARRVARRVYFVDRQGMVLHRRYQDWAGLEPLEAQERTGGMQTRCTGEHDHWRLTAQVPIAQLLPEAEDLQRPFRLNIARVTGRPAEGIPVRAASLSATFLAQNVFPAFRFGDAPVPVQAAGFSYGHVTAWHTYPRGGHEAQVAVLSEVEGAQTTIRHRLRTGDEETTVYEEQVTLRRGLNHFRWPWRVAEEWTAFTHILEVDGRRIDAASAAVAPWMTLAPCEFAIPADGVLSLHADVGCRPDALEGLRLQVRLHGADGEVGEWAVERLEEPAVGLDVLLAQVGVRPGAHAVEVALLDGDGREWARERHEFTVTAPAARPVEGLRVALVDVSEGEVTAPYPVRAGVPFPRGLLRDVGRLALEHDLGRTVALRARVVGRWSSDRSVKWAHLDFIYDPARRYTLTALPQLQEYAGRDEVRLHETATTLTVDTGALRFTVGREGFDGFRELRATRDAQAVEYATGPGFHYALDEGEVRYDSRHAPGETVIEEQTPERVTLRFTGTCASEDGIEALRYTLRLTAHAGLPVLEVLQTTIITANTQLVRFREIGLDMGLLGEGDLRLASGGEAQWTPADRVRIRQQSPDELVVDTGAGPAPMAGDPGGLFHLASGAGKVSVAVRDMRGLAPLEVACGGGGGLSVHVWPDMEGHHPDPPEQVAVADLPRLPFAHQGPLLDFNIPPAYREKVRDYGNAFLWYFPNGIAMANAMGVAPATEFLLSFAPAQASLDEAVERTYLARPHVSAAPEWMADSGAVGNLPMTAAGPAGEDTIAGRAEAVLERSFDWEMRRLEPVSRGRWVWGAAHSQWLERLGHWSPWRLFRNTHHGGPKGYWYLFARSAEPKYLAFARRATAHVASIGTCHYTDTDLRPLDYFGKRVGAACDYKGYVPWHSGSRVDYNIYADYFLNWHYLTGDPRAKEAIRALHEVFVQDRRGSAGGGRDGASRLETACSLYAHTLDSRLLPFLHASLAVAAREQRPTGFIPGGKEFGTWLQHYIDLTENPAAVEMLRRWAYADVEHPWWYDLDGKTWQPNWDVQAYAYGRFRDPALLGPALARLEGQALDVAHLEEGHPNDGYIQSGNTGWSWLHQKAPSFLWALREAGEAARPLPSRQTMATTLTVGDEWRTWAVFDGAPGETAPDGFALRLRGRRDGEGAAQVRVVAGDGRVLHEGPLPQFSWRPLPLDNPPDEPETAVVEVETGGAAGPYFLQARGEGVSLRLMLPLSNLPREVYRTDADRRFGYWGGRPRLCFSVPEEGKRVEVRGVSKGGYRISLEDTEGRVLAVQRGYDWSPGWVVFFEAGVLEPVRGQLAVFNAAREGGLGNTFTHGEDIPPFVALSPEAFFVPTPSEPPAAP